MTRRHTISIFPALEGIGYALTTQPNFSVHLLISTAVVGAGWWLQLASWEWVVVVLVIAVGLVVELVNTAIEATVDLATSEIRPLARIAKDCASAAMLVYALGAVTVAALIFVPKLWLFF